MSHKKSPDPSREQNGDGDTLQNQQQVASEMAKAFQEIAKGEQTASALERQLDGIEGRIEALLAAAEASSAHLNNPQTSGQNSSAGNSKS